MATEVIVPEVGESISEVMIVKWLKGDGDAVKADEPIVVIETDKATLEIPAPAAGVLQGLLKQPDEWANVGDVIAQIAEGAEAASKPAAPKTDASEKKPAPPADKPAAAPETNEADKEGEGFVMPAARRLIAEHSIDAEQIESTGPSGRILKEDVLRHLEEHESGIAAKAPMPESSGSGGGTRETETVSMSPMRRAIARRLVDAQQTGALLTTFNEVDMAAVKSLRKTYQEQFEKKHGVRLGFMSFFIKASIEALKAFPAVNAQVDDKSIIYHNYYDVGIAVGGGKGLVVPVLRNAELKSFADLENEINALASRAKKNELSLEELQGGTFTISNGGVYGSLMSTPIINPPQSGILGLHSIQDRPVALNGEAVIRPMMYIALTYDHRIVDGREAVGFLVRIKEIIENPARMLLEV